MRNVGTWTSISGSDAVSNLMVDEEKSEANTECDLPRKLNTYALNCFNDLRLPLKVSNHGNPRAADSVEGDAYLRISYGDVMSNEGNLVKSGYELVSNLSNYLSILETFLEKQHASQLYGELGSTIIEKAVESNEGEGYKSEFDIAINRLDYLSLEELIKEAREGLRKKKWGQELDVKLSHKKQLHECGKEKLGELWMSCRGDMNLDEVYDLARSMDRLLKLSRECSSKRTRYSNAEISPGTQASQGFPVLSSPLLSSQDPFSMTGVMLPCNSSGTPMSVEKEIPSISVPLLPSFFPGRLRYNPKASVKLREIMKELEVEFKQNRGTRELKWSWPNLKKALISLQLLDSGVSNKGFSQAISEVLVNTKAEAIRRSFSNSSARYQGLEEIENNKVNDLMARLQPVCDILVRDNPEAKAEN